MAASQVETRVRVWFSAIPLVFLTAWGLGSCGNPPCNQPDIEQAVFEVPWSINTEPNRARCEEDAHSGDLHFGIYFNNDPAATQSVKRLEQAARDAGLTVTVSLNEFGGFGAKSEAGELTFSARAGGSGKNKDWVIRLHLDSRNQPVGTAFEVGPALGALLDAVAAAS